MNRNRTFPAAALIVIVMAAFRPLPTLATDAPPANEGGSRAETAARVNAAADDYLAAYFQHFPEWATFYRIEGATHDRLRDNTAAGRAAWQAVEDNLIAKLASVRAADLDGAAAVTYEVLHEQLESSRQARVCRSENWAVDQVWGWQIALGELADVQPVGTAEERARALARWQQLPRFIDAETRNLAEGLRAGYSAPKRNVDLVVEQLDGLLAMAPEASPFYAPARAAGDEVLAVQWAKLLKDEVSPAIARHRDYLRTEYRNGARTAIAVTSNPDGEACYQALLRFNTTLPYRPKEMFEAGEQAVALRENRIAEIGKRVFGTSDLVEIRKRLRSESSNRFSTRDELLAYTTAAIERARTSVPHWFNQLPKAVVVIKPVPEYQEQSSTARYMPASDDRKVPGTYFVNLYQPEKQSKGATESVAFHETYPGHHLQIALAQEQVSSHPLLRYIGNSGFTEGWARYSETLAAEMGLYSSELNILEMLSGLPTGMVVDPGIHAMGWTREQAIEYTLSKQVGMTPEEAGAYVDRIVVWPGQMVTYGAGELEIVRLRGEAERTLGKEFDIRAFHDRVIGRGAVTLPMLRAQVMEWIKEQLHVMKAPISSAGDLS
jgi:uncharacterized protein (DUF885 family)